MRQQMILIILTRKICQLCQMPVIQLKKNQLKKTRQNQNQRRKLKNLQHKILKRHNKVPSSNNKIKFRLINNPKPTNTISKRVNWAKQIMNLKDQTAITMSNTSKPRPKQLRIQTKSKVLKNIGTCLKEMYITLYQSGEEESLIRMVTASRISEHSLIMNVMNTITHLFMEMLVILRIHIMVGFRALIHLSLTLPKMIHNSIGKIL